MDAKKKSSLYAERDADKRAEFERQLSQIVPEDRVYVDEAGVENTLSYPWGWSPKGTRCWAEKLGHRTTRVSHACFDGCGLVLWRDPLAFDLRGLLRRGVDRGVVSQLCTGLRAGQTVILDNASFNRKVQLKALLQFVG